ncbi:MAG: zinc metallopeptidase [Anaerolineae bacterium]|nr:zinc metallopeptidase [Anaerolineae bacterium]
MFFWDPMYFVFALPPLLLGFIAQACVKSAYRKGLNVRNTENITGRQAAEQLAYRAGLNIDISVIGGDLTDKYDPRNNTLMLSQGVAQSPSVGALAIVAHELGHAQQDDEDYGPLRIRSALVMPVNIGTQLGTVLFMIGFFMSYLASSLAPIGRIVSWVGILGFCMAALFALITLPVEFNASRRGLQLLTDSGLVVEGEMRYARNVLTAASLTYIAALAQAVGQVMYYVYILSGRRRRRR